MKAARTTIRTIAQLSIQNNLEEGVHHADETAIQLIEKENAGLLTGSHVPGRKGEAGNTGLLDSLKVRISDRVAFLHGGGPNVNQRLGLADSELMNQLRLTKAEVASNQNGLGRRKDIENLNKGLGVHGLCLQEGWVVVPL